MASDRNARGRAIRCGYQSALSDDRIRDFMQRGLHIWLVGQRLDHRRAHGLAGGKAGIDEAGAIDEQAGGDALFQIVAFQAAQPVGEIDERLDIARIEPAFMRNDGNLLLLR